MKTNWLAVIAVILFGLVLFFAAKSYGQESEEIAAEINLAQGIQKRLNTMGIEVEEEILTGNEIDSLYTSLCSNLSLEDLVLSLIPEASKVSIYNVDIAQINIAATYLALNSGFIQIMIVPCEHSLVSPVSFVLPKLRGVFVFNSEGFCFSSIRIKVEDKKQYFNLASIFKQRFGAPLPSKNYENQMSWIFEKIKLIYEPATDNRSYLLIEQQKKIPGPRG